MAALQPQALLVVTDTTQGMEFGIDAHVWTLGAKFEGLHSISEGLHLLTFAPGGVAGREGVFIDCVGGGVHRQRWDVHNECLDGASVLTDAQRESLEAKEKEDGVSIRYLQSLRSILNRFKFKCGKLVVDEVRHPQITQFVNSYDISLRTRQGYLTDLRSFFSLSKSGIVLL